MNPSSLGVGIECDGVSTSWDTNQELDKEANRRAFDELELSMGIKDGISSNTMRNVQLQAFVTDMKNEEARYKTFENKWSPQMTQSPSALAAEGFYFIGPGDRVKTVCCNLVLGNWQRNESIHLRHRLNSPLCRGIPIDINSSPPNFYSGNMSSYHNRLDTFRDWPRQIRQKPEEMARSGFFYRGEGDKVRCYYCGCEIRDWYNKDSVDRAHFQWMKGKCRYNASNMIAQGQLDPIFSS